MKKISEKIFSKKNMIIITILCAAFLLTPTINAKISQSNSSVSVDQTSVGEPPKTIDSIYNLLIISPKSFVDELRPLVCHKNHVGMSTRLVTLCEVYDQMYWHGRDGPEKIKYYIKTAMEEW